MLCWQEALTSAGRWCVLNTCTRVAKQQVRPRRGEAERWGGEQASRGRQQAAAAGVQLWGGWCPCPAARGRLEAQGWQAASCARAAGRAPRPPAPAHLAGDEQLLPAAAADELLQALPHQSLIGIEGCAVKVAVAHSHRGPVGGSAQGAVTGQASARAGVLPCTASGGVCVLQAQAQAHTAAAPRQREHLAGRALT